MLTQADKEMQQALVVCAKNITEAPEARLESSVGNGKASRRTGQKGDTPTLNSYLDHLLATRQELRERVAGTVARAEPILHQNGQGIIWPHTINLIQGQTGTHKSRVAELICSILIARQELRGETLGLALDSLPEHPYSVCYVDTERNLQEQFIQAIQTMKQRAGYAYHEHPAHFDYNSLLDIPRTDRLEALRQYLDHIRGRMAGHLLIILDQLADCVADFNDPKESMLLTDLLNVMVNKQDVTFLCIIHENPGGSKARGHLGTEGANKASTVLQVGFLKSASGTPSDVLQMKYIKRRSGAPNLTFRVQYDAEKGELVWADKDAEKAALDGRKLTAIPSEVIAELGALLAKPLPVTQLKIQLSEKLEACEKTIGHRLDELITKQTKVPDANGVLCTLKQEKKGNRKLCLLVPIQ
ncbi:hypothetical protein [Hymenobacter bucti]|uniref:AAA family ATPase n=1 Tax=Hymenobacter bucti TaxID=1844114 RepID=A0ABW4QZK7_9BACT